MVTLMTWDKPESPTARKQALADLVSYSEAILASAEVGDWLSASEIQNRRKKAIEVFFIESPREEESPMIAETIQSILAMDAKVTELAREGRSLLMQEASSAQTAHKQVNSYLVNY